MLKKLIAPIVVLLVFLLYLGGYAALVIFIPGFPVFLKVIFGIIALALCGLMIAMFVERVKEIRSGETDDLDNY